MAGPRTGRVAAAFWTYDRDAEDDVDIHFAWGDAATGEWEEPRPTGISGQIAKPVVLQDGRELHDPCIAGIWAVSSQQPSIARPSLRWHVLRFPDNHRDCPGVLLFYVHRSQPCSMRLVCSDTDGASWDLENELVVYATEESHREMQSKGDYSSFFDSAEGMPCPRPRLSLRHSRSR